MSAGTALTSTNRIELLDFLRFGAVSVVLFTHFGLLNFKGIAVDLFFVLSGTLVSRPLIVSYFDKKPFSFSDFYVRRFTKILPSYYFFILTGVLFGYFIVDPILPEQVPTLSELPQYFFFYRNYGGPPPRWTFEHTWSLCVEEQFYLLLPLGFYFAQKRFNFSVQKLIIAILVIGLGSMIFKAQALFTDFAEWPTYSHNRIDAFMWGILTAIYLYKKPSLLASNFNKNLLLTLSFVVLFFLVYIDIPWDPHELLVRIAAPLCWSIIIIGLHKQKIVYPLFFKRMTWYSYNIYLWHFLFVIPIHFYFGEGILGLMVYLTSTLVVAIICTHLIERKIITHRANIATIVKKIIVRKQQSIVIKAKPLT